ncbi:MAG: hypothetical protein AAF605_07370 [Myxococcota bacterium]
MAPTITLLATLLFGCGDDSSESDPAEATRLTCNELDATFCFNEGILRLSECRAEEAAGTMNAPRECRYPNGESVQFDDALDATMFRPQAEGFFPEVSATLFDAEGFECGALQTASDTVRIRFGDEIVEYRRIEAQPRQLEFEVTCSNGARYRGDRLSLSSLCGSDVPSFVYGTIGDAAFFQFGLFDESFRVFQCETN